MEEGLFFLIAFGLGTICTWLARKLAFQLGILNHPNPIVPQHTKPIAYLGGVGIFLGILITSLYYNTSFAFGIPIWFLGMSFLYLAFGVIDDLIELKPLLKFVVQIVLASLTIWSGVLYPFTNIYIVDAGLSIFWILILVNAFNLVDVCDGLVGGLSVIAFLIIFLIGYENSTIALIAAGATVGFLIFNSPPASIYLGDAGSHLLGFIAAYLTLTVSIESTFLTGFFPLLILFGVFLFELIFLIIIRYQKGLKWWLGSSDHFSLRLQASGKSKWQTNSIAWTMGILCSIPLILVSFDINRNLIFMISIVTIVLMFTVFWYYLLKIEKKRD